MPASRYYSFRKKNGWFSDSKSNYQWETWSSAQANQAQEIAPLLNQSAHSLESMLVLNNETFTQHITLFEEKLSNPNNKSLKISLQELDNDPNVPFMKLKLPFLIQVVQALVNKGYSIAFNYSEVFFLQGGETLPAHYSKTDDYHVESLDSYHDLVISFVYQFGKGLFNKFRPNTLSSETDILVASQYASIKEQDRQKPIDDLRAPLANLPCFNSPYEALAHLEVCKLDHLNPGGGQGKRINDLIILTFNAPKLDVQLGHCITYLSQNIGYSEIVIVLQGKNL